MNINIGIRMMKIIKDIQKHLQQKKEQYQRQEEKVEEMKCTMQHTEDEIKQLEYALEEVERMETAACKPKVVAHDKIKECFAFLSRFFDFLCRRLNLFVHYELACEIIFARYRFRSRSRTPGKEYLSFATILTYFKNERSMVS